MPPDLQCSTQGQHPTRRLVILLPAALLALFLSLTAQAQCTEVQKLTTPEAPRFGIAVAVEGNVMVVSDDANGTDAEGNNPLDDVGAVFVYEKEGGAWVLKAKLVAPQQEVRDESGDDYGRFVAVSGEPSPSRTSGKTSASEIRCRVSGLAQPEFSLFSGTGRGLGLRVETLESGQWRLLPVQAQPPGVYVLQASGGTLRLSQRVLVME